MYTVIYKVLESTESASRGANTAVAPELKKGVRMMMHHTRDTDQKQWNETRVLAMQVLSWLPPNYNGIIQYANNPVRYSSNTLQHIHDFFHVADDVV